MRDPQPAGRTDAQAGGVWRKPSRLPTPGIIITALCALAIALAVPIFGNAYALQLATDTLMTVVLAYSWNLISGFTGYLSFGQVTFFGLGAYVTALLVLHTPIPWYAAAPIAGGVCAVAALALGAVMLRLRGILFALGMAGLARILAVAFADWNFAGDSVGLTLPAELTPIAVYAGMTLLALAAFGLNLYFSRAGLGLDAMAIRDDEDAAAALGVATTRVKVIAFVLSAILPAIAGGLVAWNRSYLDPPSAFDPTIDLQTVVFVLFGGIGTLWGPLIGAVTLSLVGEEFLVHFPEIELALFGGLVIVLVLVFPGGLVGLANRFGWLQRRASLAPPALPAGAPPAADPPTADGAVLAVENLTVRFGGVVAVDDVSFAIGRREIVSIIGANGAGKTTLFNAMTGFVTPSAGEVRYLGRPIGHVATFRRARAGIARTFQIPRLMESLTVWENVVLASRHGKQADRAVDHAAWTLRITGLDALWLARAETLSPGRRRQLELARALALEPTIVLLDEVMAGMTRQEQEVIRSVVRRLPAFGVSAVAVEHVIAAIRDLSDRMVVLDFGRKIAEGAPDAVLCDPAVVKAYLGEPV
ncbi:MAG TPA: branched-chain amino acid ABC transporter ATP-binding protein/permease [Xanthobacteraceae bacterium]|nr:branched-chain amino acid ABC transporter ATP-binding protein/permease [Xanthobacteraceae bacterium]